MARLRTCPHRSCDLPAFCSSRRRRRLWFVTRAVEHREPRVLGEGGIAISARAPVEVRASGRDDALRMQAIGAQSGTEALRHTIVDDVPHPLKSLADRVPLGGCLRAAHNLLCQRWNLSEHSRAQRQLAAVIILVRDPVVHPGEPCRRHTVELGNRLHHQRLTGRM